MMTLEELALAVWRMIALAAFWSCFWFAARRIYNWRWFWRVAAVLVWMALVALTTPESFALNRGVPGLVYFLVWPFAALMPLIGGEISAAARIISPDGKIPISVRSAEVIWGLVNALQCILIWRFLLKRYRPSVEEQGGVEPVAGPAE